MTAEANRTLSTTDAVTHIVAAQTGPVAYVVGLGRTAGVLERATDDPVLALDAMGCISSVATGLAIGLSGTATQVVACDTDGSVLMELGALAGIATCAGQIDRLDLYVFDNERYESGGGGQSRFFELEWEALGRAFGLPVRVISTMEELDHRLNEDDEWRVRCTVLRVVNRGAVPGPAGSADGREKVVRFIDRLAATGRITRWRRAEKM